MKAELVLAALDFQPGTEPVLRHATFFAKKLDARLALLHVIEYVMTPAAYIAPYIEGEKKKAEKKFEELKKNLAAQGVSADTEVVAGRLQESFESMVRSTKADMLVLGFVSHAFRRSSSEKIVKGLEIPMLVIRGAKVSQTPSINKILCPVDFSDPSKKALGAAIDLRDLFSASLCCLHVLQDVDKFGPSEESESPYVHLREDAEHQLAELAGGLTNTEAAVREGDPGEQIVRYAAEKDIDLVIMGARGLGLIKGMLIGSVTDAVLKSSPCPVFVIH
jgi:nucleotide-binding universal stress UspA family protein